VAIPVSKIKEHCCDNDLSNFNVIKGDLLDQVGSTCDLIIECNDKYILIEEKSILFDFLNKCCKEASIDLDATYKYSNNNVTYLKVSEIINTIIQPMDINIKKRILSETITNMTCDSAKKASNTTDILNKRFDNAKTADMEILYLYCASGKAIDRIMNTWLSRYKKNFFIECQALKSKLQTLPC
jgi:hypothetical protein